jgi:hypothetical protein
VPTPYPGRADEHDLGDGHSFVWMIDADGEPFGLIEHHPAGPDASPGSLYCGGYIAWRRPADDSRIAVKHQLVAGGRGEEAVLTVAPSLQCRSCPSHGFITNGRWVPA